VKSEDKKYVGVGVMKDYNLPNTEKTKSEISTRLFVHTPVPTVPRPETWPEYGVYYESSTIWPEYF
jgi:hypothetical protein